MFSFQKRSAGAGSKAAALLTGAGLGAALMYVLDPERGKRRRALVRDKALAFANQTGRVFAKRSRDLGNRAKGVAAEIRSAAGVGLGGGRKADPNGNRPIERSPESDATAETEGGI